jgi:hypothetical protein
MIRILPFAWGMFVATPPGTGDGDWVHSIWVRPLTVR